MYIGFVFSLVHVDGAAFVIVCIFQLVAEAGARFPT